MIRENAPGSLMAQEARKASTQAIFAYKVIDLLDEHGGFREVLLDRARQRVEIGLRRVDRAQQKNRSPPAGCLPQKERMPRPLCGRAKMRDR